MSIRTASLSDWDEVYTKVIAFNEKYYGLPVNAGKLHGWFEQHMDFGVIYLSDNGIISGLLIADPVRTWDVLAETAWYDTGRDGIRLLRKLIEYAKHTHADEIRMTTLNTTPTGVETLLARMGFSEKERSHSLLL